MNPTPNRSNLDVSADLSTFITRDDLAAGPKKFRIRDATRESFEARGTRPAGDRWVLTFSNDRKFGLGTKANLRVCAQAFGKDAAKWPGRIVELFFKPDVEMGGKVVGGIRLRIPTAPPAAPPPVSIDADELDDIDAAMPTLDDDTEVL
jgi:hypothetical protein